MADGQSYIRLFASGFITTIVVLQAPQCLAVDAWHPLREATLAVEQGSILDLSGFRAPTVAGAKGWVESDAKGHLHFADVASPQRFLCASMVPSEPNGGFPDKDEANRWVEQMKRTGYNLVRFHFTDAILMTGRKGEFDFDPVQFIPGQLEFIGMHNGVATQLLQD